VHREVRERRPPGRRPRLEGDAAVVGALLDARHARGGVYVAGHIVAADLVAHARRTLKVHRRPGLQAAQVGRAQRLRDDVKRRHVALLRGDLRAPRPVRRARARCRPRSVLRPRSRQPHREAGAVDGHARAHLHAIQPAGRKADAHGREVGVAVHALHVRLAVHDACAAGGRARRAGPAAAQGRGATGAGRSPVNRAWAARLLARRRLCWGAAACRLPPPRHAFQGRGRVPLVCAVLQAQHLQVQRASADARPVYAMVRIMRGRAVAAQAAAERQVQQPSGCLRTARLRVADTR